MFNDPAIAGSWPNLVDRLDRAGRPASRATQPPALAGLVSVADLPDMVAEHVPPAHADEVIGALVGLAAVAGGDDPDAVLVLLQLLSGGVHALAAKLGHLSDNILTVVVGDLTCRIRRYPWRRRTRAYAKNLLLDTKQALLRGEIRAGLPDQPAVVLVDPHDPAFRRFEPGHTMTTTSMSSTCCSGPAGTVSHRSRTSSCCLTWNNAAALAPPPGTESPMTSASTNAASGAAATAPLPRSVTPSRSTWPKRPDLSSRQTFHRALDQPR